MPIADLHIHSRFSRATSREGDAPHLDLWARRKGIGVVGTGDCTHPAWREELRAALVDDGSGLYSLREDLRLPDAAPGEAPRFALTGEISSIYKKGGRTRKVHNVVLLPSLEAADRFAARLERVGNIHSDGRPILGLDSRDLLELLLETDPRAVLIPAHIWTPHFSLFGAFSGFDTLEECFGDLSGHIHALETGLSSDPSMNWRVSALDKYLLVSNSDAHSPARLGREANLLAACASYEDLRRALQTGEGFWGTVEFFPEEGKYHWDGHRACRVCLRPEEAAALDGKCPVCGRRLTTGVEHRVLELADRPEGAQPESAKPFERLVPLQEVLGAALGVSAEGAKARGLYEKLLEDVGPEFTVLREAPLEDVRAAAGELAAEGVRRVRAGQVRLEPGFDGQYGRVSLFSAQERSEFLGQTSLFAAAPAPSAKKRASAITRAAAPGASPAPAAEDLNAAQRAAVEARETAVAVVAGPGTGKTKTLVARIARMVEDGVRPADITAVTFTNQAAAELRERLEARLGGRSALRGMTIGTFHAVALRLLGREKRLLGGEESLALAGEAVRETGGRLAPREALRRISNARLGDEEPDAETALLVAAYERRLEETGARDMDGLLLDALRLKKRPGAHLLVDEFQDTNAAQRRLVAHWSAGGGSLFVIGDADQSIYGFRGADARCFEALEAERPGLRRIRLEENYRSTPEICRAACAAIARNPGGERVLTPRRPAGAPVRFVEADSPFAEAVWIAGEIARLAGGLDMLEAHRPGGSGEARAFSEMAVLCRTHRQLDAIEKALRHDDIPALVLGRGTYLDDEGVRACLRFLEALAAGEAAPEDEGLPPSWEKEPPRLLLEKWVGRHGSNEAMEQLLEASVQYASLSALLSALLLGEEADIRRASGAKKASGAVRLMTIHGAKGLEFPVVFLAGLTEGAFPAGTQERPADLEEERRLLFVGMTRARDELIVSGARPLSPFAAEVDAARERVRPRRSAPKPQQLSFF